MGGGGGGGWGGEGANYSLREMALSWKGHSSMPYLSRSENNFLYVLHVLMLSYIVL